MNRGSSWRASGRVFASTIQRGWSQHGLADPCKGSDAAGADELTFDDLTNAVAPLTLLASSGDSSMFIDLQNATPADRGAARVAIGPRLLKPTST
ncbi:MAG: hypothetical protein AAGA81_19750 [Acidobacteriota bacterium]